MFKTREAEQNSGCAFLSDFSEDCMSTLNLISKIQINKVEREKLH